MTPLKPTTVSPPGLARAAPRPLTPAHALAGRMHVMLAYGGSARTPDNALALPPGLARLGGRTTDHISAQIEWVRDDWANRATPYLNAGWGLIVHNPGGNEDANGVMDLDQWADAEEQGFGAVMPTLIECATPHAARTRFYVGKVESDLNAMLAAGDFLGAWRRTMRTVRPIVEAGLGIDFDAAATYKLGDFGSLVVLWAIQASKQRVGVEAVPRGDCMDWAALGCSVTAKDQHYRGQIKRRVGEFGQEFADRVKRAPTTRWIDWRGNGDPANAKRVALEAMEVFADGHDIALPVGCGVFKAAGSLDPVEVAAWMVENGGVA